MRCTASLAIRSARVTAVHRSKRRGGVGTRGVARGAGKCGVTRGVKDKKGAVGGRIGNLGASLLERADVRSWHLLPQEITLLRIAVPAGTRELRLQVGEGAGSRLVSAGPVTVNAGTVTIVPVRLWRTTPAPTPAPIIVASHDSVCGEVACR